MQRSGNKICVGSGVTQRAERRWSFPSLVQCKHTRPGLISVRSIVVRTQAVGEGEVQAKTLSLGEVSVAISSTTGKVVQSQQGLAPKQLLSNPQIPPVHSLDVSRGRNEGEHGPCSATMP